jgi:hypothetical protein
MNPAGLESTIPANERLQTHSLDREVNGRVFIKLTSSLLSLTRDRHGFLSLAALI